MIHGRILAMAAGAAGVLLLGACTMAARDAAPGNKEKRELLTEYAEGVQCTLTDWALSLRPTYDTAFIPPPLPVLRRRKQTDEPKIRNYLAELQGVLDEQWADRVNEIGREYDPRAPRNKYRDAWRDSLKSRPAAYRWEKFTDDSIQSLRDRLLAARALLESLGFTVRPGEYNERDVCAELPRPNERLSTSTAASAAGARDSASMSSGGMTGGLLPPPKWPRTQ